MKAVAVKSTSDGGPARESQKAQRQAAPVSPWFIQALSATDGPVIQCKSACACGGGCPRCQNDLPIRTKLAVSQAGDMYEQEADRVAEQVMRMPAPTLQRACAGCSAGGAPCSKCEAEKSWLVQRKTERVSDSEGSVPDNILHNLGPGQPLDFATRAFFEPRFDHDFSEVRIHSDAKAAESTRAVNALAYTTGRDVVFGAGQYEPRTHSGAKLLAHELTHVIQQGKGASASLQRAETDTSKNCAPLTDTKTDVNARINTALNNARTKAGKPLNAEKVIDEVAAEVAVNTSPGRTAIEDWASTLGATKVALPTQAATKYTGVSYRLWRQSSFPILNPTMKVNGICIGSDKLGHFLQQGYDYYDKARRATGGTLAAAEEFGERTEGGGFGLGSTGVFSNADLEANHQGLKFYDDVRANPSVTFDITGYLSDKWNEQSNPSFYESSVAEVVWRNLLTGTWEGSFTSAAGTSTPIDLRVDLTATTSGSVTGTYQWPIVNPAQKGKIKGGKISFATKTVKGESLFGTPTVETPVSGVTIEFDWEEGTASGKGKWDSIGEQALDGTWGIGSSRTNGGNWHQKKV